MAQALQPEYDPGGMVHGATLAYGVRVPLWAMGLSMITHAALLAGPGWRVPIAARDLPPLTVSLRAASPAVARTPVPATETLSPPLPVPGPASAPSPVRWPARLRPQAGTPPALPDLPPAAPPVAPPVAPAGTVMPESAPSPPVRSAPDAIRPVETGAAAPEASLQTYIHQLGAALAGQQSYPRLAALRGWQGDVLLRLKIIRQPGGARLGSVELLRSSGHEVLDRHAQQFLQGARLPEPPSGVGESEITVDVPVRYHLESR